MFPETRRKFYTFMAFALVLGFIGMQLATTQWSYADTISGMAVTQTNTSDLGGLMLFAVGIATGAIIVGSMVYLFGYEKNRN